MFVCHVLSRLRRSMPRTRNASHRSLRIFRRRALSERSNASSKLQDLRAMQSQRQRTRIVPYLVIRAAFWQAVRHWFETKKPNRKGHVRELSSCGQSYDYVSIGPSSTLFQTTWHGPYGRPHPMILLQVIPFLSWSIPRFVRFAIIYGCSNSHPRTSRKK